MLTSGAAITPYNDNYVAFTPSGPTAPLQYMDYNVYDGAPSYSFGNYTPTPTSYDLAGMQGQGFETHAQASVADLTIFVDLTSYVLQTAYMTAGRYGDAVGPRYPIAQIIDTSRYGPGAF